MKTPQKIALIVLGILFLISMTSCASHNGIRKNWYKNTRDPAYAKHHVKSKVRTKY